MLIGPVQIGFFLFFSYLLRLHGFWQVSEQKLEKKTQLYWWGTLVFRLSHHFLVLYYLLLKTF